MSLFNQSIVPALRNLKDLERMINSNYTYGIYLDIHVAQLKNVVRLAKQHDKKLFLHVDLIQGLKTDEYAAEYIIQEVKPAGLISTRSSVILKAKQKGIIAIQRLFLIDQNALDKSYKLIDKVDPDFIEVLPGVIPNYIEEVKKETGKPIFAGGLIRTVDDVERALSAGAEAVTTSKKELWKHFEEN